MKPLHSYILVALENEKKVDGFVVAGIGKDNKATVFEVGDEVKKVKKGDVVYVKPEELIKVSDKFVIKEEHVLCLSK